MNPGPPYPRPLILKLDTSPYRLDSVYHALIAAGFQIVRSEAPAEALRRLVESRYAPAGGVSGYQTWLTPPPADPSVLTRQRREIPVKTAAT